MSSCLFIFYVFLVLVIVVFKVLDIIIVFLIPSLLLFGPILEVIPFIMAFLIISVIQLRIPLPFIFVRRELIRLKVFLLTLSKVHFLLHLLLF